MAANEAAKDCIDCANSDSLNKPNDDPAAMHLIPSHLGVTIRPNLFCRNLLDLTYQGCLSDIKNFVFAAGVMFNLCDRMIGLLI